MFFLCVSCFFVVSSSFPLFFLVFSIFPPFMFVWYCVGRCHFCPRRSTPKSTPVHAGLRGIVWGDTIFVWYCVGRYDFCLVLCGAMAFFVWYCVGRYHFCLVLCGALEIGGASVLLRCCVLYCSLVVAGVCSVR